MAVKMSLWQVNGQTLGEVQSTRLDLEQRLEEWLAKDPSLTGMNVLLIGRQVQSSFGGRIDLLGMDEEGNLVIFELKRDKTPRDIVAQTLDYASWVQDLSYEEVEEIAREFLDKPLREAFEEHFENPLPDQVNESHSLVIVAAELDDASERIVEYLAETHGVSINAVFFNFFKAGGQEFLGRAWLRDPEEVEDHAKRTKRAPWTGYWFVNQYDDEIEHNRSWDDLIKYGYIGASGGAKYTKPLQKLNPGDRFFAYQKRSGYMGFGEVLAKACPIREFVVPSDGKPLLDHPMEAVNAGKDADDPSVSEWCVGVRWIKTFPRDHAKFFKGAFANQAIVCKLRDPATIQFLEKEFEVADKAE